MDNMIDRPQIYHFHDPAEYLTAMVQYRKATERSFSVLKETKKLRKVSPALVSLLCRKKRSITEDRVDELCKLMRCSPSEKRFFKQLVCKEFTLEKPAPIDKLKTSKPSRKYTNDSFLKNWLNIYVKDALQLKKVQNDPQKIYAALGAIASKEQIDKSLKELLKYGLIKRTDDGKLTTNETLVITGDGTKKL